MVNSKGEDTSILYGFTKMLLELISKEHPTHIAVAFDPPAKTFRHEAYPEYKANRSAAPELVKAALEPLQEITSHEICIVIDVVADTQEHANAVCSVARSTLLHYGYPGRIATAGNLAFPFSPSDVKVGEVFVFSVYGLLKGEDPLKLFPRTYEMIGGQDQ